MDAENEIITELPPGFVSEFADEILGTIPREKVQCELRQVAIARVVQAVGSVSIPGIGQKIATIDPRLFFRMRAEAGGDPDFIYDYLADNPHLLAPGYKPRKRGNGPDTRHSKSFVGGKPI